MIHNDCAGSFSNLGESPNRMSEVDETSHSVCYTYLRPTWALHVCPHKQHAGERETARTVRHNAPARWQCPALATPASSKLPSMCLTVADLQDSATHPRGGLVERTWIRSVCRGGGLNDAGHHPRRCGRPHYCQWQSARVRGGHASARGRRTPCVGSGAIHVRERHILGNAPCASRFFMKNRRRRSTAPQAPQSESRHPLFCFGDRVND